MKSHADDTPKADNSRREVLAFMRNPRIVVLIGALTVTLALAFRDYWPGSDNIQDFNTAINISDSQLPTGPVELVPPEPSLVENPAANHDKNHKPMAPARITHVKLPSLAIDQSVQTENVLDTATGAAVYEPINTSVINSASVVYDANENGKPDSGDLRVGKIGIDANGKVIGKAVLYGHSDSGPEHGVFDDLGDIKKGDLLTIKTKKGSIKFVAYKRRVTKKDPSGSTDELQKYLSDADVAVMSCLTSKDGSFQTGKRIIVLFKQSQ